MANRTPPIDPPVIPAATLILLRDRRDGRAPELLMIERTAAMAFAPGAMVFPGGRIDPGDHDCARDHGTDAARVAAIRETIEEVGIAVGLVPAPGAACTARLRAGLAGGQAFAALLLHEALTIDAAALEPFARWCPNFPETRSFDTWFFLARAPVDAVATPDAAEAATALWADAAHWIAAADAGRHMLIFPTRRTVERIAQFGDHAAAVAHARSVPVTRIVPWIERRGADRWLCIPQGLGYPVTAERLADARRG